MTNAAAGSEREALRQWEEETGAPASASEGNAFMDGFRAGQAARAAAPANDHAKLTRWDYDVAEQYMRVTPNGEWVRFVDVAAAPAPPSREPMAYLCPKGCGCLWRDNRDGTMSLYGPNSKSCQDCEFMPLQSLIPLYERVTATTARPEGAEWKPGSMQANAAPFLGTCRTPHFLGEPTPDRKALTQIPHYELPEGLCKDWKAVADSGASAEEEKSNANRS